jgi:hypothetical protein
MLAAVHQRSAVMPVTAKLSPKFYERLGEDVADELVNWFNAVDATYRNDLREINELNFQRFDARVGERLADLRAELRGELRDEIAGVRQAMLEMRVELMDRIAGVERRVSDTRADLLKWMFGFWIGTLVPLAGLILFNIQ